MAPVEGVSIEDVRSAIWTFRSGVNVRHVQRSDPPPWWKKFEAELDAASFSYWRPFTLPVGKHDDAQAKLSLHSAAVRGKDAVLGVQQIKSFFSNVTAAEADAIASTAARGLLHERVQGKEPSLAAAAVKLPSIKSFFTNISEVEAEKTAAAALAATAASVVKRDRAAAAAAPLGIKRFFGAGNSSGAINGADDEKIIVIDD